jgi:hypothetical protein
MDRIMYSARWYELAGAHNAREALAWADENADGRTFTLYAVVVHGDDRGMVRLFGVDPTLHKGKEPVEWPGAIYT